MNSIRSSASRRRGLEVGGLVDPGVAVPAAAELLDDALHLVARDVGGALEVHVLDPVRDAGHARAPRRASRRGTSTRPTPAARCAPPGSAPSNRSRAGIPEPVVASSSHYNSQIAMAEWKDTCNLPRTAFSMKANLQTSEPETIARWDAMDLYGQIRERAQGGQALPSARRAAVRQRRHPHRHGAQQDPEGSGRQVPQHGGLRCALPAGLGLPRPAHRAEGRSRARARRSGR